MDRHTLTEKPKAHLLAETLIDQSPSTGSVRSNGTRISVELSFAVILDAEGEVLGVLAHGRDITNRFEQERGVRNCPPGYKKWPGTVLTLLERLCYPYRGDCYEYSLVSTRFRRDGSALLGLSLFLVLDPQISL